MERFRLKNIIILILALVNVFLTVSLAFRQIQKRDAHRQTVSELTALFAADGITLTPGCVTADTPPDSKVLHRDTDLEQTIASAFLGTDLNVQDEGGGIYAYSSGRGNATFRSSGRFEITGRLAGGDLEKTCKKFCDAFDYQDLNLTIDSSSGSGSGSAIQYYDQYPVANCTVDFLIQNNTLISVSGTHIPETYVSAGTENTMTSATALTKFLEYRRQSGTVISSVTELSLCYETQSTTAAPLTLIPVWQVVADTAIYYVNCSSGTVTRA